jgi:hypothetical protein
VKCAHDDYCSMHMLKQLWRDVVRSLTTPGAKQRDAYGRLAHTLTAACAIGSFTLAWTGPAGTVHNVWRVVGLSTLGLLLFFAGSLVIGSGDGK